MVNILKVGLNRYALAKLDLVSCFERRFGVWKSQRDDRRQTDDRAGHGDAEPIVRTAAERALLNCPDSKIARHSLGSALSDASPNPARNPRCDGKRCFDRGVGACVVRCSLADGRYGCTVAPNTGLNPAPLAQLQIRLGNRQKAVVSAKPFGEEGARSIWVARDAVEGTQADGPM